MNKYFYILLLFCLITVKGFSQPQEETEKLLFFTDRDYCISGDTIWFKIWQPEFQENKGNIIHVQLYGIHNQLIKSVIKKIENNWANGFIKVPDSLSTGQYFITAYNNSQNYTDNDSAVGESILVYNKFSDGLKKVEVLKHNLPGNKNGDCKEIEIITDKDNFVKRENVDLRIKTNSADEFKYLLVRASLVDSLQKQTETNCKFRCKTSKKNLVVPNSDGFLISGRVTDSENNPVNGVLLLFTVPVKPSYLDYCKTNQDGGFNFFLKDAYGETKAYIRILGANDDNLKISSHVEPLEIQENDFALKTLTKKQTDFVSKVVKGTYIKNLFIQNYSNVIDSFRMAVPFNRPFYGKISKRIYPMDFVELANFNEICREILPGVQYRDDNGKISIQVVNESQNILFNDEALRLLNGIPVFNNEVLADLGTSDIEYIEITKKQRIFGDLTFMGILDISLYDKSNVWTKQIPHIYEFPIKGIQPQKYPPGSTVSEKAENRPDMRQTYLWEKLPGDFSGDVSFALSDFKGQVEINIVAVRSDSSVITNSKIINVK